MYTRSELHNMLVTNPNPSFSQEQTLEMIKSYIFLRKGVHVDIKTTFSEHDRLLINKALISIVRWVQ